MSSGSRAPCTPSSCHGRPLVKRLFLMQHDGSVAFAGCLQKVCRMPTRETLSLVTQGLLWLRYGLWVWVLRFSDLGFGVSTLWSRSSTPKWQFRRHVEYGSAVLHFSDLGASYSLKGSVFGVAGFQPRLVSGSVFGWFGRPCLPWRPRRLYMTSNSEDCNHSDLLPQ